MYNKGILTMLKEFNKEWDGNTDDLVFFVNRFKKAVRLEIARQEVEETGKKDYRFKMEYTESCLKLQSAYATTIRVFYQKAEEIEPDGVAKNYLNKIGTLLDVLQWID